MRKIIEKVVNEDIEAWNLEPFRVRNKYPPNFKFSALEGRVSEGWSGREKRWDAEIIVWNHID